LRFKKYNCVFELLHTCSRTLMMRTGRSRIV